MKQIHYWNKTYAVAGKNTKKCILVSQPDTHICVVDIPLDIVKRLTNIEKVFVDLLMESWSDHSKEG